MTIWFYLFWIVFLIGYIALLVSVLDSLREASGAMEDHPVGTTCAAYIMCLLWPVAVLIYMGFKVTGSGEK